MELNCTKLTALEPSWLPTVLIGVGSRPLFKLFKALTLNYQLHGPIFNG